MTSIFSRIGRGLRAARSTVDMDLAAAQLDTMIEAGELPTASEMDDWVEEKARPRKRKSRLSVRKTSNDLAYASVYRYIREFSKKKDAVPAYGSLDRDYYLSRIWRAEPILSGAVYSMCAKMVSLKWQVTGRRNLAMASATMLSDAAHMGGYSWGGFNSVSALDFYTTDRGVFWEVARDGNPLYGKMVDIGHIDSLQCTLTGNARYPVDYLSELTGQRVRFRPGEVIHFTSLPSSREAHLGIGFCAVSRALRAAKLLMGLHNYDAEKLSNLPPEGVAAVTGLTMDEFQDALALWMASRKKAGSLTFPQVLWLIGSQPNAKVDIQFVGFSQVPESFDRKIVVNQYVNTLALCFGVDAREFWPVSSGALGTAAETEVQHMKARGKGPGEYITATERAINLELPAGVEFRYDTQDIEEDLQAASVAKAWVDAFLPMTTAGGAAEEIISKDELMRLLADKDVIPDWMVTDDRVVADDMGVEEKYWTHDDVICIEWDGRFLKQKYSPAIDLSYRMVGRDSNLLEAEVLKGGPGSGHRGHTGGVGGPGKPGGSTASVGGVVSPVKYGPFEIYSVSRGEVLPDYVIRATTITFALDPKGVLHVTTAKMGSHAEMVSAMELDTDYDQWVRGVKHRAFGNVLMIETVYAGVGVVLPGVSGAADAAAMKNIKRLSRSMRSAGFPDDQKLKWYTTRGNDMTLPLSEWKEYSSWQQEDAATEFLKQDAITNEPKRNIRGKPVPEDEALRGSEVTQTAIEAEMELWREHPELSKYMTESVGEG